MLSFNSFSVIRGEKTLFKPLSVNFRSGDLVQLVGPNGRGKTSLLRVLAGIFSGFEGQFSWHLLPESLEPNNLVQLLSTDYKFAVSFSILVIVLLIRPSGILKGKTL